MFVISDGGGKVVEMRFPVQMEGFEAQAIEVEAAGAFTGPKLLSGGKPALRGVKRGQFVLRRDDGREVVYVQEDGEHFRERAVRVAARAGDRVGIAEGLRAGERIVVRGAHVVRLADHSRSAAPHGHIH